MSRWVVNEFNLKVKPYCFEQVDNFKYLGVNINDKNNMQNEIQIRIIMANRTRFFINNMLSTRMLSKNIKEKVYPCYSRPNVMYEREAQCNTQGDEEKLSTTFERKVVRIMHGQNVNEEYKRRKNMDLEKPYKKRNIHSCFKAK